MKKRYKALCLIDLIQELVSFPIMLKLFFLFFLLGTSVVALPLLDDWQTHEIPHPYYEPILQPSLFATLPTELRSSLFGRVPTKVRNHANQCSVSQTCYRVWIQDSLTMLSRSIPMVL